MYAIYETIEEYETKHNEINVALAYPNSLSSSYTDVTPRQTTDGMYAMQILPYVAHLFTGCTIVDSVEFPEVTDEETI